MGTNSSRHVKIHISNKTRNITLKNPRTYFWSGHILEIPSQEMPPGSTNSCHFTNSSWFWGCNGVLAFEAESFTLAIYFSSPIDYNRFSPEMGLELSLDEVHKGDLKVTYERMVKISRNPSECTSGPRSAILREIHGTARLSAGPVKLTATMTKGWSTVFEVVVEGQGGSGQEAGRETPKPGRHFQEK